MDHIEKIDLIRSRMEVGYKEANDALEASGGDVVQALIYLENKKNKMGKGFHKDANEFMHQIKGVLKKGKNTKIKIKQDDRTVLEVPAPVGALGVIGMLASSQLAILGALGTIAAMSKNYKLEFERAGQEAGDEEAAGRGRDMDPPMGRI